MAYIRQKENGRWQAQVYLERDKVSGKKKKKSKTFDTEKEAEKWARSIEFDKDNGKITDSRNMTVADLLRKWIEMHKKNIKGTTYDGYKDYIDTHLIPALGHIELEQLKPLHIETYFDLKSQKGRKDGEEGGLSGNSLKKHYVVLNMALKKAVKWELIRYNPCQAVDTPKVEKKEAIYMTNSEANRLIQAAKEFSFRMYVYIVTLLFTGLRRSEILGLTWDYVDFDKSTFEIKETVVVRKGGAEHREGAKTEESKRIISVPEPVMKLLKQWKAKQAEIKLALPVDEEIDKEEIERRKNMPKIVFSKDNGSFYHPRTVNRKLDKILEKADLSMKYSTHTLRHTFATESRKNGVDLKVIQKMLGHASFATTSDIYSHVDLDEQQEANKKLEGAIRL